MGRSTEQEQSLSEIRKYRKFTAQQKTEIVLASLRGPKTMAELCREHDIADSLLRKWREQFLAPGSSVPSRGVLRSPGGGARDGVGGGLPLLAAAPSGSDEVGRRFPSSCLGVFLSGCFPARTGA